MDDEAAFDEQGNVAVVVSPDGSHYTVTSSGFDRTFSAVDSANQR